jgi:hypothetical protein
MSGNLRDTNGDGDGDTPGEDTFAFCLVLLFCLLGRRSHSENRTPARPPWPSGSWDRGKAKERARNERRKGEQTRQFPPRKQKGPDPDIPAHDSRSFAAVLALACGIRGRRASHFGAVTIMVFYFLFSSYKPLAYGLCGYRQGG